jgi:predicted AlkP superfamily phosphohydrolase/phosphomutase
MTKNNRILIIGFDGGTWRIIKPFLSEGKMPNLKKLVEEGTSGILNSTIPPLTPPAWASFQTGVLPCNHYIYDFIQYQPGSYKPNFISSQSLKQKTIWQILSENGKKVVSVGVPLTYPPRKINGMLVSGLLTPNKNCDFTYPASLKPELLSAIGDYKFTVPNAVFYLKGLEAFVKELIYTEKKRLDAFKYISGRIDWDVGIIHFQSIDNLQHVLWPLLDPDEDGYSSAKRQKAGSFFQTIDENIGQLVSMAGEDTNFIVMSDHGFGPVEKIVYINKWLESKGYIKIVDSATNQIFLTAMRLFKQMDIFKLRRYLFSAEKRINLSSWGQNVSVDWPQTRAYMPMGTESSNIFLNVKGREQAGCIAPQQYQETKKQLRSLFETFRDVDGDRAIVKKVYCREDISSDDSELIPDLVIEPADGYLFNRGLDSSAVFCVPHFGKDVVGCHRRQGIYVLNGPAFKSLGSGPEASIVDLPITILSLMGVSPPDYFDGSVMNFALEKPLPGKQQASMGETEAKDRHPEAYSQADEKVLEKRLKDLGYL